MNTKTKNRGKLDLTCGRCISPKPSEQRKLSYYVSSDISLKSIEMDSNTSCLLLNVFIWTQSNLTLVSTKSNYQSVGFFGQFALSYSLCILLSVHYQQIYNHFHQFIFKSFTSSWIHFYLNHFSMTFRLCLALHLAKRS